MNPFLRKRPKPKRKEPRRVGNGRVKLYGEAKTARRQEIFDRSGGKCEGRVIRVGIWTSRSSERDGLERCNAPITLDTFHWSHNQHGPRKSDALEAGAALCEKCHSVGIHNPKSCPRKPGRKMNKTEAKEYLFGTNCYCKAHPKLSMSAFCLECQGKLSEQSRLDLERLEGKEWLAAMAAAETEILKRRPANSIDAQTEQAAQDFMGSGFFGKGNGGQPNE